MGYEYLPLLTWPWFVAHFDVVRTGGDVAPQLQGVANVLVQRTADVALDWGNCKEGKTTGVNYFRSTIFPFSRLAFKCDRFLSFFLEFWGEIHHNNQLVHLSSLGHREGIDYLDGHPSICPRVKQLPSNSSRSSNRGRLLIATWRKFHPVDIFYLAIFA